MGAIKTTSWLRKGVYCYLDHETALRRVLGYKKRPWGVDVFITGFYPFVSAISLKPVPEQYQAVLAAYVRTLRRHMRRSWKYLTLNEFNEKNKALRFHLVYTKGTFTSNATHFLKIADKLDRTHGLVSSISLSENRSRVVKVLGYDSYQDSADPFIFHPRDSIDRCPVCELTKNHCVCSTVKKECR